MTQSSANRQIVEEILYISNVIYVKKKQTGFEDSLGIPEVTSDSAD